MPQPAIGARHPLLDAHRVCHRLWVGAYPYPVQRLDFSLWVQCAAEFCGTEKSFASSLGSLQVFSIALHDDGEHRLNKDDIWLADRAAAEIDHHWRQGGRVLVTCAQGRNRSAFVAALALTRFTMMTADEAIGHLRRARRVPGVLVNEDFNAAIRRTNDWARMAAPSRETGLIRAGAPNPGGFL